MTIYKCSVCEYSYTQSFFRSHDRKLEYRGPCRLCEIEERLAALQNLAQNHAEDGSRSCHDVERDSTLASTVALPGVQAFSSGRMYGCGGAVPL